MKEKLLHERALVTCIAMLFICIILKLFGVQWFDLNTDIPILQKIDSVITNSLLLTTLYSLVFYIINVTFFVSIVLKDFKMVIKFTPLFVLLMIAKQNINSYYLVFIIEQVLLFVIVLYENKRKLSNINLIFRFIMTNIAMVVFQFISIYIRGLSINLGNYGLLISSLLMIDYYIMLSICYFYEKSRGDDKWIFHVSGSSLANLLWKKRSENYSNKEGN